MAEDLMIGFKFKETDEDIAKDAAVWDASDNLFNEISFDHLGTRLDQGSESTSSRDTELSSEFETFDFTEGFDFTF
ncbi:MAG: hypothetical protein QNJ44_20820 [Rhodobacter sp.]|nr:hypothetical protein [Rhodobacter sp.]